MYNLTWFRIYVMSSFSHFQADFPWYMRSLNRSEYICFVHHTLTRQTFSITKLLGCINSYKFNVLTISTCISMVFNRSNTFQFCEIFNLTFIGLVHKDSVTISIFCLEAFIPTRECHMTTI